MLRSGFLDIGFPFSQLKTQLVHRQRPTPSPILPWQATMSARIETILILGATRGIGEALARRFHSLGKKVIATGRRQEQETLAQLAHDLPGLEFRIVCFLPIYILISFSC